VYKVSASSKSRVGSFAAALAALFALATACGANTNPAGIQVLPKSDAAGSPAQGSSDAAAPAIEPDAGGSDAAAPAIDSCPGAAPPNTFIPCRQQQDCGDGICEDPHFISYGCAGSAPINECAQDSDCADGKLCLTQHAPCEAQMICVARCGTGSCAAGEQCGTDGKCTPAPCGAGYTCTSAQVCRPAAAGADSHGCSAASCSRDGFGCPAGSQCTSSIGMDSHGCNVPRCDQGATCDRNSRCNPASRNPDGCVPLTCKRDSDCDCGACVMGTCAPQPFVCVPQAD
jgi:hypothetical protein